MSLQDIISQKIDEQTFSFSDLPLFYELYIEIAHNTKEIQDDIMGWHPCICFQLEDNSEHSEHSGLSEHWLKIQDGTFHFGLDKIQNPDVIYKTSDEEALRLITGESDPIFALFNQSLSIDGNPNDIDNFIWMDTQIKGELRRRINREKTGKTSENTYAMPKPDYIRLARSIRSAFPDIMQRRLSFTRQLENPENDSIGLKVEQRAKDHPDRTALLFEDLSFTNREMNESVNHWANYFLNEVGLKKGDVVIVLLENRPELLFAIFGMAKIGVIASLINTGLRETPLIHSIRHSEGSAFLIGEELLDAFEAVKDRLELSEAQNKLLFFVRDKNERSVPRGYTDLCNAVEDAGSDNPPTTKDMGYNDVYAYIFTSGTTGMPKAAVITHLHTLGACYYWGKEVVGLTPADTVYITTPFFHSNALHIGLAAAFGGGCGMALRRKFSAGNFWKDARKFNATFFNYVGEICRYLYNQPPRDDDADNPIVKCAGNGIKNEFWMDFKERFGIERVIEQYGATEAGIPNFANRFNMDCTVGMCLSEYAIVKYDIDRDEPDKDKKTGFMIRVDPGETGLLLGKIDPETFYMYKDDDASKKKILRDVFVPDDAWVNTGDLLRDIGFRHAQFVDRLGDTFRWHAENVSTEEVENVVNAYESVDISCAYGVVIPGTEGRAGMVSIVLKQDKKIHTDLFLAYLKQYLPKYAVPVVLRFRNELESTTTNKIQKTRMKNEGYDPGEINDPLYILLPGSFEYTPLTPEIFEGISKGNYRY